MSETNDKQSQIGETVFERLFDASPDATLVVDDTGEIKFASAQCETLLGYVPSDLIGQSVDMLVPAPFRAGHPELRTTFAKQSRPRAMGAGRPLTALLKSGGTLPIEVSLSPITTDGPVLIAAALRDVTDHIEAEARLREARDEAESATRTKTRFLAAASHDLRQPLQSISAYASVLEAQSSDAQQTNLVQKIHASIGAMSEILDALLNVSQLDAGKIDPVHADFQLERIFTRIRDTYGTVALRKGLSLRVSGDVFSVHTDHALLERIIENLVTNAIKYTANGHVTVSAARDGGNIKIDVADSGMGIPADQHEAVFEEYVQLDNPTRDAKKGLGIGLALVKRLCELLEVDLQLKSDTGEGSIFSILVPEAHTASDKNTEGLDDDVARPQSDEDIVVLYIEDNEAILDSVTLLLELQGFQVHPAADGLIAETLLQDGLKPNIIVSDFRLPGRNGVEVISASRLSLNRTIPAIIMTGDTSAKQIENAGLIACAILHKPAEPGEIAETIRQLVAEHS